MNDASLSAAALSAEGLAAADLPVEETEARPGTGTPAAPLKIAVYGTGYLGATHAVAMAELGFEVLGADVDQAKVDALAAGKVPFFEPGLDPLLEKHLETGRLRFTTDLASAAAWGDVHFICVGTPQMKTSHAANLSYVESAATTIATNLTKDALIVGKSTVPVGTAARLRELVAAQVPAGLSLELVWNPEFLREGKAVDDTLHPDRIVLGGTSARAEATLREVYAGPIAEGTPVVVTDLPTAELVKVSANAFLATKISFINAISTVCEAAGADVTVLADALGHDVRIGRQFLNAGLGFGGGCLPKDIRALMHRANELGAYRASALLQQVDEINMGQRERVLDMAVEACGGSVLNRRIGVLGAAFKPDTDDVRDSPAAERRRGAAPARRPGDGLRPRGRRHRAPVLPDAVLRDLHRGGRRGHRRRPGAHRVGPVRERGRRQAGAAHRHAPRRGRARQARPDPLAHRRLGVRGSGAARRLTGGHRTGRPGGSARGGSAGPSGRPSAVPALAGCRRAVV